MATSRKDTHQHLVSRNKEGQPWPANCGMPSVPINRGDALRHWLAIAIEPMDANVRMVQNFAFPGLSSCALQALQELSDIRCRFQGPSLHARCRQANQPAKARMDLANLPTLCQRSANKPIFKSGRIGCHRSLRFWQCVRLPRGTLTSIGAKQLREAAAVPDKLNRASHQESDSAEGPPLQAPACAKPLSWPGGF